MHHTISSAVATASRLPALRGMLCIAALLASSALGRGAGDSCTGPTCCLGGDWSGCNTPECCEVVCAADPLCCAQSWDYLCSNAARELCGICLAPDCDGNGTPDASEYGPNALVALRPDALRGDAAEAFCPAQTVGPANVIVLTGPAGAGPRSLDLGGGKRQGPFAGVIAADVAALVDGGASGAGLGAGGRLLAIGRRAPATLVVTGVSGKSGAIEADSNDGVAPSTVRLSMSDLSSDGIDVGRGRVEIGDANAPASVFSTGAIAVAEQGTLRIGPSSFLGAMTTCEIRGQLELDDAALLGKGGVTRGLGGSSWLKGTGTVFGDVAWQGTIEAGQLAIAGDLELVSAEGVAPARVLHRVSGSPVLDVSGSVALSGNLVIDVTGAAPAAGTIFPIVRAGGGFGSARFGSVQIVGLAPDLALVTRVRPVDGADGSGFEVQGVVVATNSIIDFSGTETFGLDLLPKGVARGDFDGDGLKDIVVSLSNGREGRVMVFRGTGKGLQQVLEVPLPGDPRGLDAGDVDGDGRDDVVVTLFATNGLQVLRNVTKGEAIAFAPLAPIVVGEGPIDVALLDFYPDGDSLVAGGLDAFVALETEEKFALVKNSGGGFDEAGLTTVPSPGGPPTSVGDGDIDNDRDDDAVGGSSGGTTVIPGGGGGGTGAGFEIIFIPTPAPVTSIELTDLSGDHVPEILASLAATEPRPGPPGLPPIYDSLALYRLTGPGLASTLLDVGLDANSVTAGDLDGDGDVDVAVSSRSDLPSEPRARLLRNDFTPWGFSLNDAGIAEELGAPIVLTTISIDGLGDDLVSLAPAETSDAAGQVILLRTIDPPPPGDVNGDGVVDAIDLNLLLVYWGFPGASDLNRDGTTNALDLVELLNAWTRAD